MQIMSSVHGGPCEGDVVGGFEEAMQCCAVEDRRERRRGLVPTVRWQTYVRMRANGVGVDVLVDYWCRPECDEHQDA